MSSCDVYRGRRIWRPVLFLVIVAFALSSCGKKKETEASAHPLGPPFEIKVPLGLPPLPIPADNPPTAETIALGRKLYYDTTLSSNNTMSCASCHSPALMFSDGQRFSRGASGKLGVRNALTILNSAYYPVDFWDGRAINLEAQSGMPMANPVEMNQPHEVSVSKLNAIPEYRKEFEKAFGPGPVTIDKVEKAIASFERTLLSGNSPFDRYLYGGEKTAMSASAIRGMEIFRDKNRGNCATCHTIGDHYALFSDGKFHNIGIGVDANGELQDLGRYVVTKKDSDKGSFRTPTLRNIAKTAPYMHDGSEKTLKDVVDYYVGGGNSNAYLDKEIRPLTLTRQERADVVAFLESLTGEPPPQALPPSD
ncbi:MAG: cytochrome-c peroxidase [Bryobacteraceae bacterium]